MRRYIEGEGVARYCTAWKYWDEGKMQVGLFPFLAFSREIEVRSAGSLSLLVVFPIHQRK
uniref:Uncharacterized protein n=1 Tax=Parascaris equorum TaxID=6256 RepID=A0A914RXQ8_PAREQ